MQALDYSRNFVHAGGAPKVNKSSLLMFPEEICFQGEGSSKGTLAGPQVWRLHESELTYELQV